MVNTVFWEDNYTANLDPIEKLLFLYFLTNTSTNICGIYQITLKKIAVETGIDKEMVEKIIGRFERDGKFYYRQGWIGIKNFIKHQNQQSQKVKKGIEIELLKAPDEIKTLISGKGMDTLSHTNSNTNSDTNSNTGASRSGKKVKHNPLGGEILKAMEDINPTNKTYYNNTTQRKACDFLLEEYGLEKVLLAIKILPTINSKKLYIGQITTPYELKERWAKIRPALEQENNRHKGNIKNQKVIW